ncbi:TetR/AcrR family transcriptional regulator [Subtercola frigoramans]|uniref:AcrR family transcriptional regulator n=1 Tax=Subtercola frigoramans TaxID=120298 RepID=A0ABS2L1N3_9MICO|nr:TetR/AcrR family transcriptional regulator [Subtercola frigoramans]MBM7470998.1 AcrR family transcriptional regulator [Subtercola frigoramans]
MVTRGTYSKGAARRQEILRTAMEVIARKGYNGTTLRAIGRALGIEPAHIIYYFGTREDLLREVVEQWSQDNRDLAKSTTDALDQYATAIRQNLTIRGIVQLYIAFAAEAVDPDHPAHDYFRERFATTSKMLSDAVREGQRQGLIKSELDPDRTARWLVALADGLQLQSLIDPRIDAPADLEGAIDGLFVSGTQSPLRQPPAHSNS